MSLIRLGSLGGYSFEGPWRLGGWTPPARSGIYAILYRADPDKSPNRYSVIFVGQAENLAEEGLPWKHPRSGCWLQRAGGKWGLYLAIFYPPGGTLNIRLGIERELIGIYNPYCNEEKYDLGWEAHWIGGYQSKLTTGLAPREASEAADSKIRKKMAPEGGS